MLKSSWLDFNNGQPTHEKLSSCVEHLKQKMGLNHTNGFSCHSLRHTFCKNLIDGGIGLEQVAAFAGHESLETTRRYCQPSYHDLEKAVRAIGEEED